MTRYTWGSPTGGPLAWNLSVKEVTVSSTDVLAVADPGTAFPLYLDRTAATAATSFLLWNNTTQAYDVAASSLTVDANGVPPAFKGPDGYDTLYNAAGQAIPATDRAGSGGGTALTSYMQVSGLSDYPAAFPSIASSVVVDPSSVLDRPNVQEQLEYHGNQIVALIAGGGGVEITMVSVVGLAEALQATPAVISYGAGTVPLRSTITSDLSRTVFWVGDAEPAISVNGTGGYAVDGLDIWLK